MLKVLEESGQWLSVRQIGDALASDGSGQSPLKERTIQDALKRLKSVSLAESGTAKGNRAGSWRSVRAHTPELEVESDF